MEVISTLGTKPTLLSVSQAAEDLHVSTNLIYRLVRSGAIPAVRVGRKLIRIPRQGLVEYIATASTATGRP